MKNSNDSFFENLFCPDSSSRSDADRGKEMRIIPHHFRRVETNSRAFLGEMEMRMRFICLHMDTVYGIVVIFDASIGNSILELDGDRGGRMERLGPGSSMKEMQENTKKNIVKMKKTALNAGK